MSSPIEPGRPTPPGNDGERFVPSAPAAELALEHWHRYQFAAQFAAGKQVLDVACGVGYGAHFLGGIAARVTGIDRDEAAIAWAQSHYARANVQFRRADAVSFKSGEHEYGLIVSFETIEHLEDPIAFIDRLHRALKPGGVLIISTPDRATYARTRADKNLHHLAEMSGKEFRAALESRFDHVKLLGQRVFVGSLLTPLVAEGEEKEISYAVLSRGANAVTPEVEADHVYLLAICSEKDIISVRTSILEPAHRFNPIASLAGGIADRDLQIAKLKSELKKFQLQDDHGRIRSTSGRNLLAWIRALVTA